MRLLLSLQSLVIITAGVSLLTVGGIYGAERFGDWDGGELGFAAAISCILGKRKIVVVLLLHLYFRSCVVCSWLARSAHFLFQVLLLVILLQHHSAHHLHIPVPCWGSGHLLLVSR